VFRSVSASWLVICLCATHVGAQQWATKMFKSTSHDFGTVARDSKVEHAFVFENIYEEGVHVASVRSSCSCTTPLITQSSLKTFEKSSIVARFNTRSFLGQKGATLTVVFDKPYYAEVQLTVQGYIRSDVVFDPGEVNFGDIDQFTPAEQVVKVSHAGRSDWRVVDVRSANPNFEVELSEVQRAGGRVVYDMTVRLTANAPAGYIEDQLTVVTNDETRLQTVPVCVQGRVISPLTLSPASLFLGVLSPGQASSKQLVVRAKRPFKILKIGAEGEGFEFKLPGDEAKALHFIPVTFTAGAKPGKVEQIITIETDLGAGATASCRATAEISPESAEKPLPASPST